MEQAQAQPDPPLSKAAARALAYARLQAARAARFPLPVEGRIPNFAGAEMAAAGLTTLEVYHQARALLVGTDAAQRPVRRRALVDGKTLYVLTPGLPRGLVRLRARDLPPGAIDRPDPLSARGTLGRPVTLDELADERGLDLVVTGAVAVGEDGSHAGDGQGTADLSCAILAALGLPPVPVLATVHSSQVVAPIAAGPTDIRLGHILTQKGLITTGAQCPQPPGVDWAALSEEHLGRLPLLRELRRRQWTTCTVPDVLAPGLRAIFVGCNPGRHSAGAGHHFAGPGNHFWPLLHDSGLTSRRLRPDQDAALCALGFGLTNVVARASRGEQDLAPRELAAGGAILRQRIGQLRPGLVVLLGKAVHRAYAGLPPSAGVAFGPQGDAIVPGVPAFAAANPSARSTIPYAQRLEQFAAIAALVRAAGSPP